MYEPFASYASEYNDLNLCVIPCGRRDGKAALVGWKVYQQEPPSLSEFDLWLEKFSNANIGLITGHINRITVVDCDNPNISLETLQKTYGETPLIVKTPRGGFHLYYRYNGEGSRNKFSDYIDIKSEGGYVLAPHSRSPVNNNLYEIIKGGLEDIQNLPRSTHPSLPKFFAKHEVGTNECSQDKINLNKGKVFEGNRNNYLFKAAKDFALRVKSLDEINSYAILHNQSYLSPPLPLDEVKKIVDSVWDYKQKNRLFASGERIICVPYDKYISLCDNPKALALYMLLLAHHKNHRSSFRITQGEVGKILGCDRRGIANAITYLIDIKYIEKIHTGKGKGDGHQYRLC